MVLYMKTLLKFNFPIQANVAVLNKKVINLTICILPNKGGLKIHTAIVLRFLLCHMFFLFSLVRILYAVFNPLYLIVDFLESKSTFFSISPVFGTLNHLWLSTPFNSSINSLLCKNKKKIL